MRGTISTPIDRGYSDEAIRKILGSNLLRAFRRAGEVAAENQMKRPPAVEVFRNP